MRRLILPTILCLVAFVLPVPAAHAVAGFSTQYTRIAGEGGTSLSAFVIRPTGRGDGPFPLLVMPSSWGVNALEYVGAAAKLAYESGYTVISYTSRGFAESGGEIDIAGPLDVADARKVIDWGIANAQGDPGRVGMAGISYGSGISLLTAAADSRVRAVSAMSTWGDLAEALYENKTLSVQGTMGLLAAGRLTGRPGPVLREVERNFLAGDYDAMVAFAPERSPITKIDSLRANRPAIMIANGFQDALFPPNQVINLFERLTGPKRLMLGPGDHATLEMPGAFGVPNEIWESTTRWFDHHLRGLDNGIDTEQPVQLTPANGGGRQGFPTMTGAARPATLYLNQPRSPLPFTSGSGRLDPTPATGWTNRSYAGTDTIANSGVAMATGLLQQLTVPTPIAVALVDRSHAGVWSGSAYSRSTTVRGAPRLHATVTPSAPSTSLFAYLYDVDAVGIGSLITHNAYTLRTATPGTATTIDFALEAIDWAVPAGHRLVLIVDTVDPRYAGQSQPGSTLTVSSPPADPSRLTMPLG